MLSGTGFAHVLPVGDPGNDGNGDSSCHVRVFKWSGTEWPQRGKICYGDAVGDALGIGVALSGDGSVVGIVFGFTNGSEKR